MTGHHLPPRQRVQRTATCYMTTGHNARIVSTPGHNPVSYGSSDAILVVVTFWLSGSFRVSAGVKTSLVIDSENEKIEGENFHVSFSICREYSRKITPCLCYWCVNCKLWLNTYLEPTVTIWASPSCRPAHRLGRRPGVF